MPPDGPTAADKAAYDELLGMFGNRLLRRQRGANEDEVRSHMHERLPTF